MRFSSTLLAVLPLALAAPATETKRPLPDLDVAEWGSIQSTFIDRVWGGVSSWSWNKAEEIVATKDESKTVFQQLKADEQFSKIVKAIEFAGVADKFDDPKLHFTFFAPNNDALKPPPGFPHHHHHHDHHHDHDSFIAELEKTPSLTTVATLLESDASLLKEHDGDDEDHKRRREIFKKIVGKILEYHVLKGDSFTASKLAENSTVATMLKADDGSFAGLHRRIKIVKELVPPAVVINFYAKVISADNKASNGIFHVINHPLIPAPSLFDDLYIATDFFSTLTQAIYGLDVVDKLDYHYDKEASKPGHPKFTGNPLSTIFAPTNAAFHALPGPLKFYLFSPFGKEALAKTLMYHSIPDTLLLSELLVTKHHHHEHHKVEYYGNDDDISFHKEFDIPTVLPNATLHIVVDKSKILPIEGAVKTSIKVNDQYALAVDVQARNGAFHPLGKLLVPPHHHHDEHGVDIAHLDSWENWEEWVPAFGAEPLAL